MFVIFDLDGTLADCGHRLHHLRKEPRDKDRFSAECWLDTPIPHALDLLHSLSKAGHRIELWTARREEQREATRLWLEKRGVGSCYQVLKMKPHGDPVRDHDLKERWLKELDWPPDLVFEDRQRVVDMWRRNGVPCYQVNTGDF